MTIGKNMPSFGIVAKRLTELKKRLNAPFDSSRGHYTYPLLAAAVAKMSESATDKRERKFFVGANWKMNGSDKLVEDMSNCLKESNLDKNVEVVVSPPSIYLQKARSLFQNNIDLGAQNCYKEAKGAFTGEISAAMIKEVGGKWVILGHSERRSVFKEDDELVSGKMAHAQEEGLGVIACIGEQMADREENKAKEVIQKQMEVLSKEVKDWTKIVVAYEPIWAIGSGKPASAKQAQEVHCWIRQWLRKNVSDQVSKEVRIIYGGSVTAQNAKDLSRQKDIDGFLVGNSSLNHEFVQIVNVLKQ